MTVQNNIKLQEKKQTISGKYVSIKYTDVFFPF